MDRVTSKDGTSIAYERSGDGPAVVLVGGAADDGAENAPLAAELSRHLTAYNYARRGRAESGDTAPYAVAREIEDLEALVAEAGGSAHVFGASSGGALALEAAAAGLPVGRLVVYEVPYDMAEGAERRHEEYAQTLLALLAEGRRGDAFAVAMRTWGASDDDVEGARLLPVWPGLEALAHTLPYDAACMGDNRPPARLASIGVPTLVLTGEARPGYDFFGLAADAVTALVPGAERRTVEGQGHVADPAVLGADVAEFLAR